MLPSRPHLKKIKTEQGDIPTLCEDLDSEAAKSCTKRKIATRSTMELFPNSNTTNFIDLPDDILLEICNLKRLSVVDLIALTETCVRLKGIAIETFGRSQKICNFNHLEIAMKDTATVSRVLNTFGESIVELTIVIDYPRDGAKIIDSIIASCTSLKSLSISSYRIPDSQCEINKMGVMFERLEILKMIDVNIEGLEDPLHEAVFTPNGNLLNLFANCNSLIGLTINNCGDFDRSIFESYFPKLEHFDYIVETIFRNIEGFVLRHRNLKSFALETECDENSDFLKIVTTNCKQLENLSITTTINGNYYVPALKFVGQLEYLSNLTIALLDEHLTELVKSLQSTSLKVLDLQCGRGCSQMLPAISTMKTLRVLKLNRIAGLHNYNSLENMPQLVELYINHHNDFSIEVDPVEVIDRLINLKKFKFHANGFHIEEDLYNRLLNVVLSRPVENRLLEIDFKGATSYNGLYHPKTVAIKSLEYESHFVYPPFM